MSLAKFKWPAVAGVAVIGFVALHVPPEVGAIDKEPAKKTASKLDLTQESMPKLLALVRPQETEWRHLKVQWMTDVIATRKLATKDDKPIVVLYTGGAGYNEPLGIC